MGSSLALTVIDTKASSGFTQIRLDIDMGPSGTEGRSCDRRDRMGPSSIATKQSSNACCSDYPYCGCPKLDTAATTKVKKNFRIKLPAVKAQSSNMCCPDFPYCGCPKLDTRPKQPRFQVIDVRSSAKRNAKVMALTARPKALVGAGKSSGGCCPDYPLCGCPKL